MIVSSITLEEDQEVTVVQDGIDVYMLEVPTSGVPYDAGDDCIWDFCFSVLKRISSIRIGPPQLQVAEIYSVLKPLFEAAAEADMELDSYEGDEGDPYLQCYGRNE
jgi:hypothetical protein